MAGGSKGGKRYSPAWYVYAAAQVLKQAHPFQGGGPVVEHMYTLVKDAFADHLEFNGKPLDITQHNGFGSAGEVYKKCWQLLALTPSELSGSAVAQGVQKRKYHFDGFLYDWCTAAGIVVQRGQLLLKHFQELHEAHKAGDGLVCVRQSAVKAGEAAAAGAAVGCSRGCLACEAAPGEQSASLRAAGSVSQ